MRKMFFVLISTAALTALFIAGERSAYALRQVYDQSIREAVENELIFDPAIQLNDIDVKVAGGIVTLSGRVNNILAKKRAVKIARTVKGVKAVVDGMTVRPIPLKFDREVEEDIREALSEDPAAEAYEIAVQVRNNVVTLHGTVDSWAERELSEKTVMGVAGVKQVVNRISVVYKSVRADADIKHEVEQSLKWSVWVDQALIEVIVEAGHVKLTGVVGSAAEKWEAAKLAFVGGIKTVDVSGLKVERWARDEALRKDKYLAKSDAEIQKVLEQALRLDPRVWSFRITPEVSAVVVTLRGVVDNLKAKKVAARDARNTVGVRAVKNRIRVEPRVRVSNQKLENRVERALVRDLFLESYEITVNAVDGWITLTGSVDSYFEKNRAEEVVSRVKGVVSVSNYLQVNNSVSDALTYNPYLDDPYPDSVSRLHPGRQNPRKSDRQIKASIEDEFFWSPFVNGDQIKVTVENGKAELSGTVDSWMEYHAAQENAYEGGAEFVENELVVKTIGSEK